MYDCPDCGTPLVFVNRQYLWYCNTCSSWKYPSTIYRDYFQRNYCVAKNSILSSISLILLVLSIIVFFAFLLGLIIVHSEIGEVYNDNEDTDDDYYNNYYYDDHDDYDYADKPAITLTKGLYVVMFSIVLVFCQIGLLYTTIRDPKWWLRLKRTTDNKNYWHYEARRMKQLTAGMYFGITALMVMMGVILIGMGLIYLFDINTTTSFIAVLETFLGPLLIFLSFKFHSKEIEFLSTRVYPIIEQPVKQVTSQTPKPTPANNNNNDKSI